MSNSRKKCLYKGCEQPGPTLFKFPSDEERFYIWACNAGLDLKGDVNINEYRYLCEKHFSTKYISNQSRRKMLVHTAVPEKYNTEDEDTKPEFSVYGGEPAEKKSRTTYIKRESSGDPKPMTVILNSKSTQMADESIDMIESDCGTNANVYEEVVIPPTIKRSYKCIVVKQKKPEAVKPVVSGVHESTFFLTEEENILSSNCVEQKEPEETVVESPKKKKSSSTALEYYSEFIFNGELYVQMPKRVYEAEKEKIAAEGSKYKAMLMLMKKQIDDLLAE